MKPNQIKYLIENYNEPVIFTECIDWQILNWSLNDWEAKLENKKLKFRKNQFIKSKNPLWEESCQDVHMTMKEFVEIQSNLNRDSWLYFDYKYMLEWFKEHTDFLQDISWQTFGYPEKSGRESTIWIGTEGAHTPCHKDTYGCNLIAQVHGRKLWILFPPEENLKPTRVPYEESSIYSQLNFFTPQLSDLKGINNARSVTLNPGEVLFLPQGWWHYVENVETAISVNVWLPQPEDDRARIDEALAQLLVIQMTKELTDLEKSKILNPNSGEIPDLPLSSCITTLEHAIEAFQFHDRAKRLTSEQTTPSPEAMDIKQILKTPNIKTIPKLSNQEYYKLLRQQETKYFPETEEYVTKTRFTNLNTVIKIINSVCHPEILSAITDKLLKE